MNQEKFLTYLTAYKKDFLKVRWPKEKFKWEAVKCFQDHWNMEAEDFAQMLTAALEKSHILLASGKNYPRAMIQKYASVEPEQIRNMFAALFDEHQQVADRISAFKNSANQMQQAHPEFGKSHYQNENSISTYLWLRYPDQYFIYKFTEARAAAKELEMDYSFSSGDYLNNLNHFYAMYNEVRMELMKDQELTDMLASAMTDDCDRDTNFCTLTIDFCFFVSRYQSEGWEPVNYHPGLTKEDWAELLLDRQLFTEKSLKVMKRMLDYGPATCTQLANKYGCKKNFYLSVSVALAERVVNKKHCKMPPADQGHAVWWPILYVGKQADEQDEGSYIWKLREELEEALADIDLSVIPLFEPAPPAGTYKKQDFLQEVYLTEPQYDHLVRLLEHKKNIILQGAPGVGKTYSAKRLAYSMMGFRSDEHIEMVQFHQSYSYEDFVMGYKPTAEGGFKLQNGVFYRFCIEAKKHPEEKFFFIIDEINRGNLSKIFGELLMMIEKDYRGVPVKTAYSDDLFFVPENVYIIGMMNTADRSLAMIDYALRRRFSFFSMQPALDQEAFIQYVSSMNQDSFSRLIQVVRELNQEIMQDPALGEGFCIGHSYFCNKKPEECTKEWMELVVEYDLIPTLKEYWFDDPDKEQIWAENLRGALR